MKQVLVLCTGNSCRSQMAEGYLRYFGGNDLIVHSAGIEAHGLNSKAVDVMKEDGIDISKQTSNKIDEFVHMHFDLVITVCDNARENCPVFPGKAKMFHQDFPDPAKAKGNEDEILQEFRNTRDLIKSYCKDLVEKEVL